VDLSRKVLAAVDKYMAYQEAQAAASSLMDQLGALTRHMTNHEYQAYEHVTGMYDLTHGIQPPPLIHAASVPMPALTPDVLDRMDAERTPSELTS
jgi:hypothetical protein